MHGQETVTNATLNLFGTTAAVFVAILLMALVVAGFEPVSQLLDVRLPVRQLLTGRSLHALALSGRASLVIVRSYFGCRIRRPQGISCSVASQYINARIPN